MRARNANNATWFMLRYPEQFTPPTSETEPHPSHPQRLDGTLFYDDARHVLELLPEPLEQEAKLLPGLAVDADGEIYRVERATWKILVGCGKHERPLVCEPQVFAGPRGLALDRRGYLYVADARARRVMVLLPEDGSVCDVLNGGHLTEPVDVAIAPTGRIYLADRGGESPDDAEEGQIAIYSARHQYFGRFPAQNAEGLPQQPRPIAVMIDADESVLVADANHPRLLRFSPWGEPLADVVLSALTAALDAGEVVLDALHRAFGKEVPRFIAGGCLPPRSRRDGGEWLAEVHRAVRLLRLRLGRRFAKQGTYISGALDSGTPGTAWHRIKVDADLPPGTSITVETATYDDNAGLDLTDDALWSAPGRDDRIIAITSKVSEHLIQSQPGRFLWARVSLYSNGHATPSLQALQIFYPRFSYLDLLPRVYRRDSVGAWFLERFLALFESIFAGIEDRYEEFSKQLNPDAAPMEIINWLACLVDLCFDPSWPLARRRALVNRAMELYRKRGTPEGVRLYVEIYTGTRPEIIEAFLQRPAQPAFLGKSGSVLGCPMHLAECRPERLPEEQLLFDYAHRFTVLVYLEDECDAKPMLAVVDRIVEVNKPAHTAHTLCPIYPNGRVAVQSTLGLDLVVGGRGAAGTQIGGRAVLPGLETPAAVLGVDSVLGERRPSYVRPLVPQL